jgi:hypothetical protein
MPLFQCLNGRQVVQRTLWNPMVIGRQVVRQRCLQFARRGEAGVPDDFADAAVESLDHAIGLRVARPAQPVLNAQLGATQIEGVLPTGLAGLCGKVCWISIEDRGDKWTVNC